MPLAPSAVIATLVKRFDALAAAVISLEAIYRSKVAALDELKKSLLHQAFTGQFTSAQPAGIARQPAQKTTTPEFTANVIAFAHAQHEKQYRDKTFGHVKAQKVLHVVESIAKIDLGRYPIKDAAGPNDSRHMHEAEDWARSHGFFDMVKRGEGYEFTKLGSFEACMSRARASLKPHLSQLEKVIDILVPMVTKDAEVFVTVHAAWNNLLIDRAEATDDAIVWAARESWHANKLRIEEHKFRDAIALIRRTGLVPDGTAKYVGGQQPLL